MPAAIVNNLEQWYASVEKLRGIAGARANATMVFGHDPDQINELRRSRRRGPTRDRSSETPTLTEETIFTWGAPPLKFGAGAIDEIGFELASSASGGC